MNDNINKSSTTTGSMIVVNALLADLVESDGYRPLLVIGQNIMVVMGRYIYLL